MQRTFSLGVITLLLFIVVVITAGLALAQAPAGQEYIVQPGDRLTVIAAQFLGDRDAYPQIVEATNAKAAGDASFAPIANPNLITAGQKLWIPVPGFVGVYTASVPAASSPGQAITLSLTADAAQLSVDYLNGEAPIVETGIWQDNGDGTATVTLSGRADGTLYEAPSIIKFQLENNTLTAVEYDPTLYGSEGLILQKQTQTASTLRSEDVAGIYKVMLPGASSPGLDITLYLNIDNTVRQVSDYLNGDPPIVEVGTWQIEGDRVVLTLTGQESQPYDQPSSEILALSNGGVTTIPTGEGAGRWTYLPFDALASGQQQPPYDPIEAGQIISQTGLTGIYKAFLPAATCCGQDITLSLNFDNTATLKTHYLNNEAAIVETGVWTATNNSAVGVALNGAASPLSLTLSDGLLVTAPGEAAYGLTGLKLYRLETIALNSLQALLTGTVTYRQRLALSPETVITVQLVDVSKVDAPGEIIASQVIMTNGRQVPFNFELIYHPLKIQDTHTYAVQARIEAEGQLRFISTTRYPVLTQGAPNTVEVVVDPTGAIASAAQRCATVAATPSQDVPPEQSNYLAYEPNGTVTSELVRATLTIDAQTADTAPALLSSLGFCGEDYVPERVTIYPTASNKLTVVAFTRVNGDDSVAGQEVRLDLTQQTGNQWQVTWGGVRFLCARGNNTTDLIAALCP
jgi:putative lipoprotein